VRIWALAAHRDGGGTEAEHVVATGASLDGVAWLDDRRVIAGGHQSTVLIERGRAVRETRDSTRQFAPTAGGLAVLGGLFSSRVRVLDQPFGTAVYELACATLCPIAATSRLIATGDERITVYDARDGSQLAKATDDVGMVGDIAIGGPFVAVAGFQVGTVFERDGAALIERRTLAIVDNLIDPAYSAIKSVALTRDGSLVASGYLDGTILVENTRTGARLATLRGHLGTVQSLAFAPDGSYLVSGGSDATALVWPASAWSAEVR
jgi:hypothetical protein